MSTTIWFKGRFAIVQLIGALGWSSFASYMFFCSLAFQVRFGALQSGVGVQVLISWVERRTT